MIKNFQIFKIEDKKSDKEPDYRLTAKVEDKFMDIGAGWIKTSPKGTKYISCQLNKPYQDKKGFGILDEDSITSDGTPIPF